MTAASSAKPGIRAFMLGEDRDRLAWLGIVAGASKEGTGVEVYPTQHVLQGGEQGLDRALDAMFPNHDSQPYDIAVIDAGISRDYDPHAIAGMAEAMSDHPIYAQRAPREVFVYDDRPGFSGPIPEASLIRSVEAASRKALTGE